MPFSPRLFSFRRLALVLLVAGAAYAWWVTGKFDRLNAAHQLDLADAGAAITRTLVNAVDTVRRFQPVPDGTGACAFDADQPYLDYVGDCRQDEAGRAEYTEPRVSAEGGLTIAADRIRPNAAPSVARWRFRIDTLLRELALSDTVALVFVADRDGRVLYQHTPRESRWRRQLRWGERTFEDAGASQASGVRVQNVTSLLSTAPNGGWERLRSVSDRATVRVGGAWHQLFVQPISIGTDAEVELTLAAVVPSERLVRQAFAIDTYFMALLVVTMLLGLLGLPFVKLVTLSPHERLRVRDVYWLYVSCAALLALGTFVVLSADTYRRWTQEADEGLARMAGDIEGRIAGEVLAIREQLASADRLLADRCRQLPAGAASGLAPGFLARPGSTAQATYVLSNWLRDGFDTGAVGALPADARTFVQQITWIDPQGDQIWKVTSDTEGTNRNVSDRLYFQAVRDGHLYYDTHAPGAFFMAPDRSVSDGRFYTFVSMPSALDTTACPPITFGTTPARGHALVASAQLLSTDYPALPTGYGFAVVTRDGRVLYHSDARLALRENFFDHLDDPDAARAIAQSATTQRFSARYREVAHRVQITPLPWTLAAGSARLDEPGRAADHAGLLVVAFRDISVERAIVSRTFVVNLVGPMLLLMAGIAAGLYAAGAVSHQRQGGWARWLWPHGGLAPMYKVMTLAVGGVVLAFIVVAELSGPRWPYLLLPVCAVLPGLAVYGRSQWHAAPRSSLTHRGWYIAELSALGFGMVVVPACVLFTLTLGYELGSLIRTEQGAVTRQLGDAGRAIEADVRALGFSSTVGQHAARAHATWQTQTRPDPACADASRAWMPPPYCAEPVALGAGDRWIAEAYRALNGALPAESASLARLRYQSTSVRYVPRGSLGPLGWTGLLGLGLIAAGLAAWIRWSAIHLHYADVTPGPAVADAEAASVWASLTEDERHVLEQATEEGLANPRQRTIVVGLARKGLLRFTPELRPATAAVRQLLTAVRADRTHVDALAQWEHTHDGHSWQQAKPILLGALGVVAVFLVATQPGLQSDLVTAAGGVAALGASLQRVREFVVGWFRPPTSPA